jgi:mono/diheme cytochrome c family protein
VNRRHLVALLTISALLVVGCGRPEMRYELSEESKRDLPAASQQKLFDALEAAFGTPVSPKVPEPLRQVIKTNEQGLAQGATGYRRMCMHCHGLSGGGNGPTAGTPRLRFLEPLPRDYRRGMFKFTSTESAAKPTRDDLLHTVRSGVAGTSMPSFALYDPQEIERTVDYVILLSVRGETERFVVSDFQGGTEIGSEAVADNVTVIARSWASADTRIVKPKVPRPTAEDELAFQNSIKHGKELFLSDKVQCFNCHGKEGRGDGLVTDPEKTTDVWGNRTKPADLTIGLFRGGGRPIDLFRRIHDGVKGTPMPAQANNLTDADIWDLVNYIRTLPYQEEDSAAAGTGS